MLDERKLSVLRAIVEDYVATNEPVGSKSLVERHQLGVSPATVRNDMSALEDEGYITQPHTSAGRIPTDAGYRLFVDRLATVKPLSVAERRAIHTFLDGAIDLDDVVARTVRLLAQLTRQVAVVQYPSLTRSRLRHVELVPLGGYRVMVVVITTTGRVEQRVVDLPTPLSDESLSDLRNRVNGAVAGQPFSEVPELLVPVAQGVAGPDRSATAVVLSVLLESLVEPREERLVLAGTANLARFGGEFSHALTPVLEALEEQMVLLRLLGELTGSGEPGRAGDVSVRIGHEIPVAGLTSAAMVSTSYGVDEGGVGRIGVLGPTRMDYPGTISAVLAVARYVSRLLEEPS